jgi:beta-lactamase class A
MSLKSEVEAIIARSEAAMVAVGFYDVESRQEFYIHPELAFHAASTMKVCVLLELFHQAEMKELSLDEPIQIRNVFSSIVDGSPFSVGSEDDSEQTLYARIGEFETALQLAKPMISQSSNLATNLLVDRLKADRITEFMASLDAPGLIVRRGVEDGKAFRLGMNNTVTARGLTQILKALATGSAVSSSASQAIIDILLGQTHRNSIPAGIPESVPVANKQGWNDEICHDCGIIFPQGRSPYVLTVLTQGLSEKTAGEELVASISRHVFKATVG